MSSFDNISIPDGRTKEGRVTRQAGQGAPVTKDDEKTSSLARAEARLREIRDNLPEGGALRDKFWAPQAPVGWTYEWKVRTVMNEEMSSYIVELARNGWEAVPLIRHPEMMPQGWKGETIEVEGLVLMERPSVLTEEDRAIEARNAREAVLTKENQLRSGRGDDLGRREVHRFSKSRGPIDVPSNE
jgi:hypothetical protein